MPSRQGTPVSLKCLAKRNEGGLLPFGNMEWSRQVSVGSSPAGSTDEGNESDRAELLTAIFLFADPAHPNQHLQIGCGTDRDDEPPADRKL